MKKTTCLLVTLVACIVCSNAQSLRDEFDSNYWGWTEFSGRKGEAVIREGRLCLTTKLGDHQISSCYLAIDPSKNFQLVAKFINTKIDDEERGIGIVFNYMDDYNYDMLSITKEYAVYARYVDDKEVRYRRAQIKMNKKAKDHELKLVSSFQKLEFYIDNMQALEVRYAPLAYNGFGIVAFSEGGGVQTAEVDFISITQ